jgi:TonB-dependent starch-binding outer membrane protein SusC
MKTFHLMRVLAVGLALPLLASGVAAQVIDGSVVEDGSRLPLAAAEVVLLDARSAERGRTMTDASGRFRLGVPASGVYTLLVRHLGYATFTSAPVEVGGRENVTIQVRLGRTAVPLEPLVVTGRSADQRLTGFDQRRQGGSAGRFITRAEVERRAAGRTSDLLRGTPSIQVMAQRRPGSQRVTNAIMMRGGSGSCEPAVYIDGTHTRLLPESTIDDIIRPETIEGVEIYSTAAAAPSQFGAHGACGVILFWTRPGSGSGGERMNWRRALVGAALVVIIVVVAR